MRYTKYILMIAVIIGLAACAGSSGNGLAGGGKVITSSKAGDLTVTLTNARGELREGENEFTLEFRNASGEPVEVGAITLFFDMPAMGSMPYMKNDATLTTTGTPGVYRGQARLEMKGTWQTRLSYKGPAGEGQTTFNINAK
ncbi:MAG: FixH family protein [Acidobacteriota bacterium]|nr:MAG: FixH family protein [Acidobacteriota bacterium]